tara:strand:+ start:798 stop:1052 length:255 start_codon:yes stop_codon:yes gene_type:complete
MLVEGIGKVTFVNGVLRVQTVCVNSGGESIESGSIEIPGNMIGDVINGLATATKGINDKLAENNLDQKATEKKDNKKSSSKKKK